MVYLSHSFFKLVLIPSLLTTHYLKKTTQLTHTAVILASEDSESNFYERLLESNYQLLKTTKGILLFQHKQVLLATYVILYNYVC